MNLVILGPQGSGKGTQANILAESLDILHIEMGLLLRTIANEDTELGKKVDKIIHEDKELVGDDIAIQSLKDAMRKLPRKKGVIFDGVPRTVRQIEPFEDILKKHKRKLDRVIYISLPRDESVKRISCRYHCNNCGSGLVLGKDFTEDNKACIFCNGMVIQRSDDTIEGVNKRLDVFYSQTLPVIERYKEQGIILEVDGMGNVDEIQEKILAGINEINQ